MRELAQEWLAKEMRKARIALGQAEGKQGVTPDELRNLQNKVDIIDWLLCQFGELKFSDDCTACAYDFTGERSCVSYIHHLESRLAQAERPIDADLLKGGFEEDGHLSPYIEEYIDACPTIEIEQKWISVEDRLPEGEDPVLIFVKETEHYGFHKEKRKVYYCQYLAYWDGDEWLTTWCNGCRKISDTAKEPYADDYEVTHWMALPEGPKEDSE